VIGRYILRYRAIIGISLLLITGVFGYYACKLTIGTSFIDFFPKNHPYVKLYHDYERYGGAQRLTLMVQVKHGDIFNYKTLRKIQDITYDVDLLPDVNHQSIRSLGSFRVTYAIALPGNLVSKTYMYPNVPTSPAAIAEIKREVFIHRQEMRNLVSDDGRSAAIIASFYEGRLNYHDVFNKIQGIVKKYQDDNTVIYAAGEPMIRGYGYYYLPVLVIIFFISDGIMVVILYIFFKGRSTWWAPLITGLLSTIWGIGFIGMQGYEFDPVMLVIRFILTARDMSHGIQWQGRYYDELETHGHDKMAACEVTTTLMLPPGMLSILADIAGIVFISFGGIPSLQHVASSGAVWLGGSLTMVFIFQPIMMSYLPTPKPLPVRKQKRRSLLSRISDKLVEFPTKPGYAREGALVAVGMLIVVGFIAGVRAKIGYTEPGTPLYRHNAKVNKDINAVRQVFPLDEGWIIVRARAASHISAAWTPDMLAPEVIRLERDLGRFMLRDPRVTSVISVVPDIIEPYNQMFHYGNPKYLAVPRTSDDAMGLYLLFVQGTAPGEAEQWINMNSNDAILRILLSDHTYQTLNDIQARLAEFVRRRAKWDPAYKEVEIVYLGGIAGLYAAANDVLYQLDFINITFVLGVVFLFCAVVYRSLVAGVLFVVSCIAANFAAFIYMRMADIGITIDTIPVISLGIGLGVDYGIYAVSRICDECAEGKRLEEAIVTALRGTGAAVLATFSVIVGGLLPWVFSPVLFHNEMSVLLIILMSTNVIVGLLILPAYIAWARPRFIFGGVAEEELRKETMAAASR
jgi:predicted RND superfamily exporter protein